MLHQFTLCPVPTRRQNRKLMTLMQDLQFQVAEVLKFMFDRRVVVVKEILYVQLNLS